MLSRFWIISIGIVALLISISLAWYGAYTPQRFTIMPLAIVICVGLIGLNRMVNHYVLDDKLIIYNTLFQYPWYKLAGAGVGIILSMMILDDPFNRLTAAFAVSSITLGRDHRWSAFAALDMLMIVICMLLLDQQTIADGAAIYLYYFLVIATVTMIVNNNSDTEQEIENISSDL